MIEPLKTRAITIKRSDYSETSQWATFYTADFGKINVIAKGSKRKNRKFDGPIDLLSYHHIVFLNKPSQHIKILMEYELLDSFMPLRNNLDLLTRGIYTIDFLDSLTALEDRNPVLFNLALDTLKQLAEITPDNNELINMVLFAFETRALKCLGYMPNTRHCARCNRKIINPDGENTGHPLPLKRDGVVFSSRAGGAVCRNCRRPQEQAISTNPGVLSLYYNLSANQTSDLSRLKINQLMIQNLRKLLDYYIATIAGEPLKTATLVQPAKNFRSYNHNKETILN